MKNGRPWAKLHDAVPYPASCLAALALGLSFTACTEQNDADIVIIQAQPVTVGSDSCDVTSDRADYLPRGVVDMAVARNYELYPLVQNNIADIVETKGYTVRDARINTKDVSLRRATVKFHPQEEISVKLNPRVLPLAASVPVEGLTAVAVELLSPAMVDQLRNAPEFVLLGSQGEVRPVRSSIDLVVEVKVDGETQDGNPVESNDFFFNLRVCNGCLVYYPPDATSPDAPAPNCLNPITSEENTGAVQCAVGWENPIHCGVCAAFAPDPLARQLCQPPL